MRAKVGAAFIFAVGLSAACATAPPPTPSTSTLFKTNWTAVKINGDGVPVGETIALDFGDHKVAGVGGCNHYVAAYEEHAPNLSIHDLSALKATCAPSVSARESVYFSILVNAKSFAQDDRGGLTITASDGRTLSFLQAGS